MRLVASAIRHVKRRLGGRFHLCASPAILVHGKWFPLHVSESVKNQLDQFDVLILDMQNTFMFNGDRFSLSEDYHQAYVELGGRSLGRPQLDRVINGVFSTLSLAYVDCERYDDFPSVAETLELLPESREFSASEIERLVDVFAVHEVGEISTEYASAIKSLSNSHELHLASNIWAPKDRYVELFRRVGIDSCFTTTVFSSDSRSIKPSSRLFAPILNRIQLDRAALIGDSLRCDVGAANKMGLKCFWLSHDRELPEESPQPDWVVRDLLTLVKQDDNPASSIVVGDRRFLVVRTFSDKHIRQYCELYDDEWPNDVRTHDDLRCALHGAAFAIGVVEETSDDLVGFCRVVSDQGYRAWILGLVVQRNYRGQGLGRVIMDEILSCDELAGLHSVGLSCSPELQTFYRKWGFQLFEDETVMKLGLRGDP